MVRDRILVAYATKHGSTADIAEVIGDALRHAELEVDVRHVSPALDPAPYRAVILGSAVYMTRWQREALEFLRRNESALREQQVWLFSSGPLDYSGETADLPAPPAVQELATRIGVRGHATFGGRLDPEVTGFLERLMVKGGKAGDYRDFERIRGWADSIARTLAPAPVG